MDEIHELLGDKRILFILNSNLQGIKLLGLTATIDRKTKYVIQKRIDVLFFIVASVIVVNTPAVDS